MRQAINNLQSVVAGFEIVNEENVHLMIDSPHPMQCRQILEFCGKGGDLESALKNLNLLWQKGYAPLDIITTLFRVAKTTDSLGEQLQLDFIRVRFSAISFTILYLP